MPARGSGRGAEGYCTRTSTAARSEEQTMAILRVQHSVPTYGRWKQAFDSDPVDRRGGGVRRYTIHRSVAEPNFVMIDLEFDRTEEAEAFLRRLRDLWEGAGKEVTTNPEAWIVETVESAEL
jgi:hypothetical protein